MNLQEFSALFGLGGTFGRVVDDTTSLTGPWGGRTWLGWDPPGSSLPLLPGMPDVVVAVEMPAKWRLSW